MFRHFLASVALVALTPGLAQAGGLDRPAPRIVLAPPATVAVQDWAGTYAGLGFGTTQAIGTDRSFGASGQYNEGNALAAFAGHQWQHGRLVYGAELSYATVSNAYLIGGNGLDDDLGFALDAKARVGFAANNVLAYGVVGYSTSVFTRRHPLDIADDVWDLSGMNYGVGAEYLLGNFSVGLEYLRRDLGGDGPTPAYASIDVAFDTISLRVAYRF